MAEKADDADQEEGQFDESPVQWRWNSVEIDMDGVHPQRSGEEDIQSSLRQLEHCDMRREAGTAGHRLHEVEDDEGAAPASQVLWARELDYACRPNCLGAVPLDVIRPSQYVI